MKKVLSPLLSALLLAGCAAGTDVPTVQPTAAPETPDTAQSSETAETAGAAAAPQGLIPTDAPVLDYDDIRLIAYVREFQTYPDTPTTIPCAGTANGACCAAMAPRFFPAVHRTRCLNAAGTPTAGTVTQTA